MAMGWEVLEFNFSNQLSETVTLNLGLTKGWTFDKASLFFNFEANGATAGEKVYYFDNVSFGTILSIKDFENSDLFIFSNPTSDQ